MDFWAHNEKKSAKGKEKNGRNFDAKNFAVFQLLEAREATKINKIG